MTISVHRYGYRRMAEVLLDGQGVSSLADEQSSARMPQIVKSHQIAQACHYHGFLEVSAIKVVVEDPGPAGTPEDEFSFIPRSTRQVLGQHLTQELRQNNQPSLPVLRGADLRIPRLNNLNAAGFEMNPADPKGGDLAGSQTRICGKVDQGSINRS